MRRRIRLLVTGFGLSILAAFVAPVFAEGAHKFVGAEKCKLCHNSVAKGAQYTKWSEMKHSKAYAALGTEEAKKIAQAKGIADPQKASECLKCHVTGQGVPADQLTEKYKVEDGVSCESCHGAGGDYWQMAVMKDPAKAAAAGLLTPDEATCKRCHNAESPTFKSFDYASAKATIAHPNPQKNAAK
jgi:cytochrome c554/c'-like protein